MVSSYVCRSGGLKDKDEDVVDLDDDWREAATRASLTRSVENFMGWVW